MNIDRRGERYNGVIPCTSYTSQNKQYIQVTTVQSQAFKAQQIRYNTHQLKELRHLGKSIKHGLPENSV